MSFRKKNLRIFAKKKKRNLRIMEERIHSHQLATVFDIPCFPESEKSHLNGGGTEAGLQFREKG